MQDSSHLSLGSGRTRGASWGGVPGGTDRAPGMKSHWIQAGAWNKELSPREGWHRELPHFIGASGLGETGALGQGHKHLGLSHPPTSQLWPGHRADVPGPLSPWAALSLCPCCCPPCSIPGTLPGFQAPTSSPLLCNLLFGSRYWVIYSNSAKCFGSRRRARS